ncbi:hypothetical protein IAD21_05340 [Abditibacteriota bacterium]|nr:hypothetical protein IAD21_05340 [Abditibacteriota bacterium]
MNPFDLSEFEVLKQRADESAREPQPLPTEWVTVNWNGNPHHLELQLVLLDGDKKFVMFSPPERPGERFFVGTAPHGEKKDIWNEYVMSALCVSNLFWLQEEEWTDEAVKALERGAFGRMRVQEHADASATFDFFGSTGYLFSWNYIEYIDGMGSLRAAMASPDYDPQIKGALWCEPLDARQLLLERSEDEVFALVSAPDERVGATVRLSRHWPEMSHDERRTFLPPIELAIEAEVQSLMRALLWSDPHWSDEEFVAKHADFLALWRQPRFCLAVAEGGSRSDFRWNLGRDDALLRSRLKRLWQLVGEEIEKRFQGKTFDFAPCVAHWMRMRGGYIVQVGVPTHHEHLESRLLIRDFLAQMGESLEKLENA